MKNPEFMDVRFKIGDPDGEDEVYLCTLESGPKSNSILNDKLLFAIYLKKGANPEEATELMRHLNRYVTKIGMTFME